MRKKRNIKKNETTNKTTTSRTTNQHSATPTNITLFAHPIGLKKLTMTKAGLEEPELIIPSASIAIDNMEKTVLAFWKPSGTSVSNSEGMEKIRKHI